MVSKRLEGCMHVSQGGIIHQYDSVSQLRQSDCNGGCAGHGEGQLHIATVTIADDKRHFRVRQ